MNIFLSMHGMSGEGMYLEPDEYNGYRYLEAVRDSLIKVSENNEMAIITDDKEAVKKEIATLSYNVEKFKQLFQILDKWLLLEQEKRLNFSAFFCQRGLAALPFMGWHH